MKETKIKNKEKVQSNGWNLELTEVEAFNQLTALNNELVNVQRVLVKQNEEIKCLNQQLLAANADLKEFSYAISHDIKEPLRMVVGFMSMLKKKYSHSLDAKAQTYINTALDGGTRMQRMTEDLLHLSALSAEEEHMEKTCMQSVIKEVELNLLQLIRDTKTQVIIASAMPVLIVNKSDLSRLFQNLISNAIKFNKKNNHPVVIINAEEKEHEWQFSIKDNGIGIPPEYAEDIFKVFKRLHPIDEYDGSGIGLAMCKRIIDRHGGKIWMESQLGNGSTFYFTIKEKDNESTQYSFD